MKTTAGKSSVGNKLIRALLQVMRRRRRSVAGRQTNTEITTGERPLAVRQREVQFADFAAVANLKERCGMRKDSLENWERLWRNNPAIGVAKSPLSMGWVLEAGGKIVGYGGSIPLLYRYGDRVLLAAAGTGLAADPAYRVRSIGLLASFFRQENIDLFLITTAIESVGKMSRVLKAETVPQPDYDTTLFWVLNRHHFAKALVRKFGIAGIVGSVVARTVSCGMQAERMFLSRGPRRASPKIDVTEIQVDQIGDDFEALWQRKLKEKPCLLADRSRTSLRWHLTVPGSSGDNVVLCCHRDGRLVGYAVVQNVTDKKTGLHRSNLIDLLVDGNDSEVTESLLVAAYAKARTSGSHVFEVLGFPQQVRDILVRWKPHSRQYPACPFVFKTNDPALHAILEQEDGWYACPFDGDTSLLPY